LCLAVDYSPQPAVNAQLLKLSNTLASFTFASPLDVDGMTLYGSFPGKPLNVAVLALISIRAKNKVASPSAHFDALKALGNNDGSKNRGEIAQLA
jgi:hypothetical protein